MDGKKLLVLSDTHGCLPALKAVLIWAKDRTPPNGSIRAVIFLGDGVSDLGRAAEAAGFYSEWKLIRGNNDYEPGMPDSAVFDFEEHRFFLCHGHYHNLYSSYNGLISAARNNGADTVLFGHTHVPFYKNINGILLINPGSAGRPRSRVGSTFAVIECKTDRSLNTEFFKIGERGEIKKLKI